MTESTVRHEALPPVSIGGNIRVNEVRHGFIVGARHAVPLHHIIRDEQSWDCIREYIVNNPLQWELGRLNPTVGTGVPLPRPNEPWRI